MRTIDLAQKNLLAALPPDVRRRLCPAESSQLKIFGAAPQSRGIAPKEVKEVCAGRSETSRTSGGRAAGRLILREV